MNPSRRSFLASAAALAAASPFGAPAATVLGANETLRVGCIGTGGRCRTLMKSLAKIPDLRVTAICDVYSPHLDLARPLADPSAFATASYKALLDRDDVDAVLIGAPDHWHVPLTVAACDAGKDVYVEKPLTHSIDEAQLVLDAQARSKQIVQVGTQQRSMPHIREARDLIRAGRLGPVSKIHLTWNRNTDRAKPGPAGVDPAKLDWKAFLGTAPDQPFDDYRYRNWRWFWDFGGGIFTDLMVHWIDVAHWVLDLDHPESAASIGTFHSAEGIWQTPDTVQTLLTYPGGLQAHFEGTFTNAREGAHIVFMGPEGSLDIDRGGFILEPEPGRAEPITRLVGTGRRGLDFYDEPDGELLHLTDWVDSVRSRRPPSAPVSGAVSSASAAHLANLALRSGQATRWADLFAPPGQ